MILMLLFYLGMPFLFFGCRNNTEKSEKELRKWEELCKNYKEEQQKLELLEKVLFERFPTILINLFIHFTIYYRN